MKNISNANVVDTCSQRLNALHTHVAAKTSVKINGTSMSLASVIGVYQTSLDNRAAVSTKRNELKMAMKARTQAEATRRATDRALKAWVITQFGADSKEALDFGFAPSKVTPKTAETKALAAQKGRTTRKARQPLGKKGTVPSTAPAVPAPHTVQMSAPAIISIDAPAATAPASSSNGAPNGALNGSAAHA